MELNSYRDIKLLDLLSIRKFLDLRSEDIEYRPIIVLISVALCLCINRFIGSGATFTYLYSKIYPYSPITWQVSLWAAVYWSIWCFISYFAIPVMILKFIFKENIYDYGLKVRGISRHLWLYGVLYLIVLIGVFIASFQESFLKTYPFVQPPPGQWRYFLIFEVFYFFQFCTLEFFFRGYMIFEMEKKFGIYSIFIMVVPYCMIHFQKPFLEAIASIIAGTILGMIALRTRSIWYGILIHCSVALSMDIVSLIKKSYLFVLFQ